MGLSIFDIACTNDCDEVLLPALPEDPFCVPAPVLSEVNSIILTRVGGTVPTATTHCYSPEDPTLDGVVKYTGISNDRDPILVNVGGTIPTATRTEQLP